ncbi:hypothetical protein [Mycolicibacterium iranicum]|uniref:PASTA domain-containing protein n=1 Tax=Mycolicibacterium iranicum TaxID=912594 RepID=A0A178LV35_MYCIR|nr:hypothetical protein [Mycolicibacterium iranicum]OAN38104.1 hypothetical protein A4X20_19850 [Mycolicibacterium iranicum]
MVLKGLAKQARVVAVAVASCGMVLGVTAPIATAQDSETWEMPDLEDEILQDAVDSVISAAGEDNITFNIYDRDMNQVVYNYTNWVVCGQSPSAEREVTVDPAKPQRVTLALSRRTAGC